MHLWFSKNYNLYRSWHSKPYHSHIHWASFFVVVLFVGMFLLSAVQSVYAVALPSALVMGTDHIPDFSQDSTKTKVTAVKSGTWSDATVWSNGILPRLSDIVIIPSGKTVTYDSTVGVAYTVSVSGSLKFRTDINTKLIVTNLEVMSTGYLEIGTTTTPVSSSVTAEVVISNTPIDTSADPEQWGTGFLSFGKVRINGSMKNPTFLRVATEPMAGQNTITLAQAPTGWNVGDRIFIPDTRHLKTNEVTAGTPFFALKPQWEEFTIAGISGNVITLNSSLLYNHKGARDVAGNIDFLPHIGNLTRNVVFRSENPLGTRGHMAMIHMADADIRYAAFRDMGRTTYDLLAAGTNQKGRYALHMHHDMGPMSPTANGYQFTLVGNAIDGGSSVHKFKWGITVHDSHFGLIQDNVVYNMGGAGIMTEDGNETLNVFDHNFVERVAGTGDNGNARGTEFGYEGAGIWLRGPNNIVRNNVVSNFTNNGITYFHIYLGNVKVPKYKGADTSVAGQYTTVNSYTQTIPEFDNNELYGSGSVGLTNWWLGSEYGTAKATGISVFKNTKIWHVSDRAVYNYPSSNLTYDGLTIRGDASSVQKVSCCGVGYEGGDYFANNVTFKNIDIQGMTTGMHISTWAGGTQTIENSILINKNDIGMDTMWTSSCDSSWIPPRLTVIKNTKLGLIPGVAGKTINMNYQPNPVSNVIQKDEVYVIDYNKVAGSNFRVYYNQADPNYVVPQGYYSAQYGTKCVSLMSSPVAGLTNTQAFAQYGFAVAGTPATCSDKTTHPEINGITCPYTSIPTAPLTKTVNPTGLLGGPIISGNQTATVSMSASPASVSSGGASTIVWSSTVATSCTASGGWSGTKATSGTVTVNPATSTTYTLTCGGTNINSASQSVTVAVGTGSAPTLTLSASPTSVTKGGSSTLTWSSTNTTSCTASNDWSGAKATSGSQSVVPPDGQSAYTLTCLGSNGTSVSQKVVVPVVASTNTTTPGTVTLSSSASTVVVGSPVTLTWSSTVFSSCAASGSWSGAQAVSGTQTVNPTTASTYTLTCSGTGVASVSKSVTVATTLPADTTAPAVSGVSRANLTSSSVDISWVTDEPANGQVEFVGNCPTSGCATPLVSSLSTSHSISVSGLTPFTSYTFKIISADAAGNTRIVTGIPSFTTLKNTSLTMSASATSVAPGTTVTITWASTGFSTCAASDAWMDPRPLSGSRTVTPTTTSTYTITCSGAGVTSISKSVTVAVVLPPDVTAPNISALSVGTIKARSVVVSWTTNEPANGQVEITSGNCPATGCLSTFVSTYSTSHSITLTGLTPNTTYTFKIRTADAAGNLKVNGDGTPTFKTIVD